MDIKSVVVHGDTYDQALEKGVELLGVKRNNVIVEVIEEGQCVMDVVLKPYKLLIKAKQDEVLDIYVTENKMQAYGKLIPAVGGISLTYKDVLGILQKKGVIFGIDYDAIKQMLDNREYNREILIAQGQPVQNGQDGDIKYYIEIDKKATPKINDDGSVDYYHLDLIENVNQGQLLATIIPPTPGIPGKNVLGQDINSRPGKPVRLSKGKNVYTSDDELSLFAAIDGKVELINNKLHVYSVYEVKGNVDNSTGDIDFVGNVIISGNVLSGFSVKAGGNIKVNGVVEGATLIARGDIVLKNGMQGMGKGYIQAEGNVVSRFIENGTVVSRGNVLSEAIMHSNIKSGGRIQVGGRKGLIVGGQVKATSGITAMTVGSPMATSTVMEVGVDPSIKEEYLLIKKSLDENITGYNKAQQALSIIESLEKMNGEGSLPPKKQVIKLKALNIKNESKSKIDDLKYKLSKLEDAMIGTGNAKINVRKMVYPGVIISIGNTSLHVRDDIEFVTFKNVNGEIVHTSFEG